MDSASGVLALEACRAADRLEDLDAVVRGKGVVELLTFRLQHHFDDEAGDRNIVVKVEFGQVLAEARQQQAGLKALLESLGVKGGAAAGKSAGPAPAPTRTALDELAARREVK